LKVENEKTQSEKSKVKVKVNLTRWKRFRSSHITESRKTMTIFKLMHQF